MHGKQETSWIPRTTLQIFHVAAVAMAAWCYFGNGLEIIYGEKKKIAMETRQILLMVFSIVILVRLLLTTHYIVKRRMGWEEVVPVIFAVFFFHMTFAICGATTVAPIAIIDYVGIVLFILGSYLNTGSELQRLKWKQRPENQGKLYTQGLFSLARHINYFGDTMYLVGFAILTCNWWSAIVPIVVACGFLFFHIPLLTKHLKEKYQEFADYARNTKMFIPFVY